MSATQQLLARKVESECQVKMPLGKPSHLPRLLVKWSGRLDPLALVSNHCKRMNTSEFQTVEKVIGSHSNIFPKKAEQFTVNNENNVLDSHDRLRPEKNANYINTRIFKCLYIF